MAAAGTSGDDGPRVGSWLASSDALGGATLGGAALCRTVVGGAVVGEGDGEGDTDCVGVPLGLGEGLFVAGGAGGAGSRTSARATAPVAATATATALAKPATRRVRWVRRRARART
ncbi:hypothetical protein [Salinispora cortesiana]|uniref:hypothetical protein n=1 Tax=Salinispora cortesiana TaxID=1305843 RepID=UPI001FE1A036|nr:hypothetical protein [Salinispora cortesiana]